MKSAWKCSFFACLVAFAGCGNPEGPADGGALDAATRDGGSADVGAPIDVGAGDGGMGTGDVGTGDAPSNVDGSVASDGGSASCPFADLGRDEGAPVVMGTTAGSGETRVAACAGGEPSAARSFLWTAPRSGTFLVHTTDSAFDTALVVLSDDCAGPEVTCDDDGGPDTTSRAVLTASAGEAFVIFVTGYDGTESGAFSLSIEEGPETETACMDGIDEDRDGDVDCADDDCAAIPACIEMDCGNGVDDDGDGAVDCDDLDCEGSPSCGRTSCVGISCIRGSVCMMCPAGAMCIPEGMACP